MQGIILLVLSFIVSFILSKTTNLKPLTNYNDKFEYIPILTSNILADILIVFITYLYFPHKCVLPLGILMKSHPFGCVFLQSIEL